jgi:hypothetical protein
VNEPVLFVIGTGRCGSTLVHDVLAKHPGVAFISAADERLRRFKALGRLNGPIYRSWPGAMLDRLPPAGPWVRRRFIPSEAYKALDEHVAPCMSAPFRDLTEADVTPWLTQRFRAFVGERLAAQSGAAFVHKFTGWPRARLVHAVFPEAYFLHVVRDGRAVANSLVRMAWWPGYQGPDRWPFGPLPAAYDEEWRAGGRSFPLLAGLQWKLLLDAFEDARARVPAQQWMEVRYEDFVQAPREHLGTALEFVGIKPATNLDRVLSSFEIRADRRGAYREELTGRDNDLLDAALERHLARYGYLGDDG